MVEALVAISATGVSGGAVVIGRCSVAACGVILCAALHPVGGCGAQASSPRAEGGMRGFGRGVGPFDPFLACVMSGTHVTTWFRVTAHHSKGNMNTILCVAIPDFSYLCKRLKFRSDTVNDDGTRAPITCRRAHAQRFEGQRTICACPEVRHL
jgi:hypothetical protein